MKRPREHCPPTVTRANASPVRRALRFSVFLMAGIGIGLFMFGCPGGTRLSAQEEETAADREYRIKAAYLYQFGRYIQWPANTFDTPKSPFVIGVVGKDPIGTALDQIAETRKIQGRAIRILRFSSLNDIKPCQILFIPASVDPEEQTTAIHDLAKRNTLLVGESDTFLELGGVMRFAVEENKVRVFVARQAAKRENLTVSAKLLQVAHVVD